MCGAQDDDIVFGKVCSRSSQIGREGERYVRDVFEATFGWPVQEISGLEDRGIDLEITLPRGKRRIDSGVVFYAQVKSTKRFFPRGRSSIRYSASMNDLALWVGRAVHSPGLLVLYFANDREAYWVDVLSAVYAADGTFDTTTKRCLGISDQTGPARYTLAVPTARPLEASRNEIETLVADTYRTLRKSLFRRPALTFGFVPQSVEDHHRRSHNAVRLFQRTPLNSTSLASLLTSEQSPSAFAAYLRLIHGVSNKLGLEALARTDVQDHILAILRRAAEHDDYLSLLSIINVLGKFQPELAMRYTLAGAGFPLPQAVSSLLLAIHASFQPSIRCLLGHLTAIQRPVFPQQCRNSCRYTCRKIVVSFVTKSP